VYLSYGFLEFSGYRMRYLPDVNSPKYLENNIVNGDLVDYRIKIKHIKNNRSNMGKETKGNSS
jgi:hypothetical protein